MIELIEILFVLLIGASIGSFANVIILRVPEGKSIVAPPSSCYECGTKLKFYNNIPIFSYIFLWGRSSCCKKHISLLYPIGEAVVALIFVSLYLKIGFDAEFVRVATVFTGLYVLSVIDIRELMIPDTISLPLSLVAVMSLDVEVLTSFLIVAGAGAMFRFYLSAILKKEAMGEGDIIIFAILGAILGVKLSLIAIFLASLIALPLFLILGRDAKAPFIPFLALGGFVSYIFDEKIMTIIRGLYG
jgi:leader peptidase (prepilin peptidase)/N-methyltransferase